MNADGTGQTRLTNNSAIDDGPAWSPDGTKIAFTSDRDGNYEIYSMNADGTGQTRLTNNAAPTSTPPGRPTGSKIAFDPTARRQLEIYVDERRRHRPDPAHQRTPRSTRRQPGRPTARKIVFDSNRDGNPRSTR